MTDRLKTDVLADTPAQAAARAWLHAYGINTSQYTKSGGDHPAMHSLPEAFQAFARRCRNAAPASPGTSTRHAAASDANVRVQRVPSGRVTV